ncbi:DUF3105 domain-containing protein [Micromonospora peucetia]|uniref:DUF3105 domain-containing protein n=1 Tax=Micromonospora peucetia TaxID=47871 RepID=A0A1C6W6C8_9ACTN|nr:DUF3105 domain-containing protein [Micromonospora peucetia]MCX4385690.1 DUF3105 domain-containing protein [Micromonospora peucetia]WSA33069.1 DUF3105 domain-containing protein [Micromonospora peucetia]SCL74086.1 Protein of unknown function (DUF3105) [Micromonospora peucetia]
MADPLGREARATRWVAGLMALLGVGLLGWVAVPVARQRLAPPAPIASFGVAGTAAGCDPELTDPVSGKGVHVGRGARVAYLTVPPSSGPHYELPAPMRRFYLSGDRPPVEVLVHNLEHGYTVVWYSDDLPAPQVEALRGLAARLGADERTAKFVAAPWDEAYGRFPPGRRVGISRWGATAGYRLLCESVSGAVIERFLAAHPPTDSPEPEGA